MTTIHQLPTEILSEIFAFCSGSNTEKSTSLAISHTCHLWRECSLRVSQLWSSIHIVHLKPSAVEMHAAFLERSRQEPLDYSLELEIRSERGQVHYQQQDLDTICRIIFPVLLESHRWRSLRVVAPAEVFNIIKDNFPRGVQSAPLLEVLILESTGPMMPIDYVPSSSELHLTSTPRLTCLKLRNVRIPSCERLLQTVVTAELQDTDFLRIFYDSTLKAKEPCTDAEDYYSPLKHLSLIQPAISHRTHSVDGDRVVRRHLEDLSSLLLSQPRHRLGHPHTLFLNVLHHVRNLRVLVLEDLAPTWWREFFRDLSSFYFQDVYTLVLSGLSSSVEFRDRPFLSGFPAIEQLALFDVHASNEILLSIAKVGALPSLKRLLITDADYRTLRTFVEARTLSGLAVPALMTSSSELFDINALTWLKRNVLHFTRDRDGLVEERSRLRNFAGVSASA